jgi:hypothetical protein
MLLWQLRLKGRLCRIWPAAARLQVTDQVSTDNLCCSSMLVPFWCTLFIHVILICLDKTKQVCQYMGERELSKLVCDLQRQLRGIYNSHGIDVLWTVITLYIFSVSFTRVSQWDKSMLGRVYITSSGFLSGGHIYGPVLQPLISMCSPWSEIQLLPFNYASHKAVASSYPNVRC